MNAGYYNIENLVKFALIGPRRFSNSYRYSNYKVDFISDNELDLIIRLNSFKPDIKDCSILDDKYYIRKNYFYCKEDDYKILRWEVEIKNLESLPIHVNINLKPSLLKIMNVSYILLEGIIIDPLIHYILTLKKCALIHASCIAREDEGFMFIARGGAGKTTIATHLIGKGFNFISDNYTILTPEKDVIGFIEPLNIFTYNLNKNIRVNFIRKTELKIKSLIYKLSKEYIKLFTRINPLDIFTNIDKKTKLRATFLLLPCNEAKNTIQLFRISKDKLTKHICYNQILEFPYFDRYITVYSYVLPNSIMSEHWENYRNLLDNNLCENIYLIKIPQIINKDVTEIILGAINNDKQDTKL